MYSSEANPGLINELIFSASRSGGPGGQNVNKVSSKIELRFNIADSKEIAPEHKEILMARLFNKINNEGFLIITSQESRSQLVNKEKAIEKFFSLINSSLAPKKKRKATKPSYATKEKRLNAKRIHSEKKKIRGSRPEI